MNIATSWIAGDLLVCLGTGAGVALASAPMLSAVKTMGLPAKNCQYCHTDALPKKETFKPEGLNERGKFLMTDMRERNLKAVDVGKLKDYPSGKEQR